MRNHPRLDLECTCSSALLPKNKLHIDALRCISWHRCSAHHLGCHVAVFVPVGIVVGFAAAAARARCRCKRRAINWFACMRYPSTCRSSGRTAASVVVSCCAVSRMAVPRAHGRVAAPGLRRDPQTMVGRRGDRVNVLRRKSLAAVNRVKTVA